MKVRFGIALALVFVVFYGCSKDCPTEPVNNPPEISEILTDPSEPVAGESVLLNAIATDKDGDQLSYNWSSDGGSFRGSATGNPVTWDAPYSDTTFTISCIVSDGKDTVRKSLTLQPHFSYGIVYGYVYDKETGDPVGEALVQIDQADELSQYVTGYYRIQRVGIGHHAIGARKYGYQTYSDTIYVRGGERRYDIYMSR